MLVWGNVVRTQASGSLPWNIEKPQQTGKVSQHSMDGRVVVVKAQHATAAVGTPVATTCRGDPSCLCCQLCVIRSGQVMQGGLMEGRYSDAGVDQVVRKGGCNQGRESDQ